ncbi:MAG: hypothetical protein OXG61_00965 [Chloroflexi bacterium]|nr:hypothetical protein [Chloroflexota bacterium]
MEDTGSHDTHDAHLGPSARRRAEPAPRDHDAVTLDVEFETGPRTKEWDELWVRLLARVRARMEADRHPYADDASSEPSPPTDTSGS